MRYLEIINEALNMELTIKNWDEQLRDRISRDRVARTLALGNLKDEELVNWFAQWDPTPAKKYLINWILPRYIFGGINGVEDLEGIRDDLENFNRFKHHMPIKDIIKIKTASELGQMVRDTLRQLGIINGSSGNIPVEEMQAANQESIKVYEDTELLVVIPLTQRAAGFWGRFSNWCTAYGYKWGHFPDRTSWFNRYNSEHHRLLIWYNKTRPQRDRDNYQCYYGGTPFDEDIQIMDLTDLDVTLDYPIEDYIAKLSHDQIQIIVDNCLAGYKKDPYRIRNGRIEIVTELENIVADFGNDNAQHILAAIQRDNIYDYVYQYTSIHTIVDQEVPANLYNMLEQYLTEKYPNDVRDTANTSLADVLLKHRSSEREILDQLTKISYQAHVNGVRQQMIQLLDQALFDAGISLIEPGNYDGMCTVQGPTVREWIGYPKMFENNKNLINIHVPGGAWDGYDSTVWNSAGDLVLLLGR